MAERRTLNRPVTAEEVRIIRTALEVAATSAEGRVLIEGLEQLQVVSACTCGCDSLDFARADDGERAEPLAHATAQTLRGGTVGVIVWGTASHVTGLEIYDLGAGNADLKLPIPSSIQTLVAKSNL